MANVSTADARNKFSDLLNRVAYGKERTVLTRRGKELVAVIPVEDLRLLEELEDRIDIEEARKALAEPGESIAWEALKKDLGQ